MYILTHRGLDPARKEFFAESSMEAFADHLERGYGLEFDLHFGDDGQMVAVHNPEVDLSGCHLAGIPELLGLIMESEAEISALHLKYKWQEKKYMDELLSELDKIDLERIFIFDVKIKTAKYLKKKNKKIHLAPSVSHPYDIERYNRAVGGTLVTLEEALQNRDLFDFVWLDEWDRSLPDGGDKTLYNEENFDILRKNDFKIALVTPELHATSPGLLGGESHQDARDQKTLVKRLKEIISLEPDIICTDWPDLVRKMV